MAVALHGLSVRVGATGPAEGSKLAALSWLAGDWRTKFGDDDLEEHWSAPFGDSMMGVFRWVKGGKVWMFELLSIVGDGDDIVFRLKHFDNQMVGWEEKDKSLSWKLSKSSAEELVFEKPDQKQASRLVYRRSGDNELHVRLEGEHDGKPSVKEFKFTRVTANKP
jgi:hypothetical protein